MDGYNVATRITFFPCVVASQKSQASAGPFVSVNILIALGVSDGKAGVAWVFVLALGVLHACIGV